MIATAAPPDRRLITGGEPDSRFPIPAGMDFIKQPKIGVTALAFHDYIPAPELRKIGEALIAQKLTSLQDDVEVEYLWKRRGGTTRGKWNMGKCQKLSGVARYRFCGFSASADFVVWLAADFCEAYKLTRWQMEALLFHELLHIEIEEPEDQDKPTTDHDFEGFYIEITEYGLWQRELARLSEIVQPSLPFIAEI